MLNIISKQFKISQAVITMVIISMMHYFFWLKIAAKVPLHDKAMLQDAIILISKWMSRIINMDVPMLVYPFAIFPTPRILPAIFTIKQKRTRFSITFLRAIFSIFSYSDSPFNNKLFVTEKADSFGTASAPIRSFFTSSAFRGTATRTVIPFINFDIRRIKMRVEFFFTKFAYSFYHLHLQIKRALFGGLSETVKSLHLLRAQVLDTKIPFLISNCSVTQILGMSI